MKLFAQSRCCLLVCVLTLFCTEQGQAGPNKKVRDWSVWCSDDLNCQMHIYTDSRTLYSIGFARNPKANSPVELFISVSEEVDTTSHIRFRIDKGRDLTFPFSAARLEEGTWNFADPNETLELLNAMMGGQRLSVKVTTKSGRENVGVSLSGVTGTALFMDEAQGRVGNRDALQAKGDGEPVDAKTRVTVLTGTPDLPGEVSRFWQNSTDGCAEGYPEGQDLIEDYGGISIAVEDEARMFILPCGSPGAYNLPHVVLMYDPQMGNVRRLSLPIMGEKGPTLMNTPYNVNWDDRLSTLSAFFKGRGIGDCGFRNTWYWKGGYFSDFQLLEEYAKQDCDERHDNWPRLWPPE